MHGSRATKFGSLTQWSLRIVDIGGHIERKAILDVPYVRGFNADTKFGHIIHYTGVHPFVLEI